MKGIEAGRTRGGWFTVGIVGTLKLITVFMVGELDEMIMRLIGVRWVGVVRGGLEEAGGKRGGLIKILRVS